MTFSFSATPDFDFLTQFAQYLQVPVHDDQVTLPEHLGQGYVRKLQFGVDFRLTIHCYELHEDLVVRRQAASGSRLPFSFTTTSSRSTLPSPTTRRCGFPSATNRPFSLPPTT
jgi:hypothetical protein